MSRYSIVGLIALLLAGCALKHPHLHHKEQETTYLFEAIFLEGEGAYEEAAFFYEKLFALTHNKEYLYKSIANYIKAKDIDKAMQLLQKSPKDYRYYALAARLSLLKKDLTKAIENIKKALQLKENAKDYEFLAHIYLLQKEYQKALKYYQSAYAIDPNPKILNTIAYIMYFYLNRPTEALAYLETFTRMYGCKKSVCTTLASLYSLRNDTEGLIFVYKRLYERYKEREYAKKLVDLLIYTKEYEQAQKYAKILKDDKLLLDLYKAQKKYKAASKLAAKLYQESRDPNFLAQSAMFEYEGAKKKDRVLLEDVAKKLRSAVKKVSDPLYLNYLGYLLIDHDMNIKEGISYVKRALQKEPNSPYYLDSLAWGYYKLKKCKKALKAIKRVYYELGLKDPEVQYHLKMIEQCVKEHH